MSRSELATLRSQLFSKWVSKSSELKSKEFELKKSMPSYLRKILAPKRIVLLAEVLKEGGGYPPCTGVVERCLQPSEICVEQLSSGSVAIFHSVRSRGDAEVDKTVRSGILVGFVGPWILMSCHLELS